MVLISRFLLIGFCCFLVLPSFTQTSEPNDFLPAPSVSSISSYGYGDGLPETCLENVVVDSKGRLWATPCLYAAKEKGISFFQFDGRRAYFYSVLPDWTEEDVDSLLWLVEGETSQGFLFGVDEKRSVAFLWRPDTRRQSFFRFEEGKKILSLAAEPQGGVLALILHEETYQAYRLADNASRLIGKFKPEDGGEGSYKFPHPFVITDGQAWFLHKREGLVCFDLKEGNTQFYSWSNFGEQLNLRRHKDDRFERYLTWKIFPYSNKALFLYLGGSNGFFTLDLADLKLIPQPAINQRILSRLKEGSLRINLSQDKKNNLLIIAGSLDSNDNWREKQSFQALLANEDGQLQDYTDLIEALRVKGQYGGLNFWAGNFFAEDFQRQIGWSSFGGLIMADLQPELQIKAFPMNVGARAIASLDSLHLLVNTDSYVFRLDLRDGAFDFFANGKLDFNTLTPFIFSNDQNLWAVGDGDHLLRYNLHSKQYDGFRSGLDFDKFTLLNRDEIALFSRDGQLFIYSLKEQLRRPFLYQGAPFSIGSTVNELLLTTEALWVAARNGLWRIDFEYNQIEHFDESDGLPDANIICLLPGENGRLWLGTATAGILIFHLENQDVNQIADVNGLAHNTVAGMLADEQKNIWAATFNGMSVISPQEDVLFNITALNGLTHNEFNRASYGKLPDGRMVFGGVKGINILDPERILKAYRQKGPLHIYLTQMEYYDKKKGMNQILKGASNQDAPLRIPATNRYLNLDFTLSEYVDLPKHTYAYRIFSLKEPDRSAAAIPWINLGAVSELTLNNLPVGDYVVEIRGIDQNSRQVETPLAIPIHVEAFFYRTWQFYFLCAILIMSVAWIYIHRILTERERLKVEVDRRTEQIQRDKEIIARQAEELQQLDQAKSRFFANISHELRTPLTIILGMVDHIEKQPRKWTENGAKMIRNNGANLLNLVNQILDLQKLESGKLKVNMELGDIIPFLRTIFDQFQAFAVSKGQQMAFIAEMESQYMDYDPEKILRIVSNLLANAVKYTPEKGKITLRISYGSGSDLPSGRHLVLAVSDTGPGIGEDQIPYIFDRFYQAAGLNQGMGSSTGIGLSLTRELVQLLNGKIEVSSRQGKGTSFQVLLPITQEADPGRTDTSVNIRSAVFGTQGPPKIERTAVADLPIALIVEDNPDIAQYLQICLEGNYQIRTATNGQAGIDMALEQIPDIIISDIMMPEKDGFELCEILKEDLRTSHIPILLLTARSDVESRIAGLKQGADDYLAKPFHEEELLVRMNNLLEIRAKLQQRYQNVFDQTLITEKETVLSKEDAFVLQFKEIFEARLDDPDFNLEELSQALFMSRSHLSRKIKALTGRSLGIYIRSLRLQKARQLLLTTDLSVKEIGYEVGLFNPTYFSRTYQEEFGESPSQTRNRP